MTKKIKDLTIKELKEICSNYDFCDNCPLNKTKVCCASPYHITTKDLEIEVEVDE